MCLMTFIRRWTNREFRRFAYKACTGSHMLTVRVVVLEYSQLHKKSLVCEFGGFENDVGICIMPEWQE